jgi:hypothetical protein
LGAFLFNDARHIFSQNPSILRRVKHPRSGETLVFTGIIEGFSKTCWHVFCGMFFVDLRGYLMQAMEMLVEHGAGRAAEFTPSAVAQQSRQTTKAS